MKHAWFGVFLFFTLMTRNPVWSDGLVVLQGRDFDDGGAQRFGYDVSAYTNVNYVYAQSTGLGDMHAEFALPEVPSGTWALGVEGLDNDVGPACPIEIRLNGKVVFEGANPFWRERWDWWKFFIPQGTLRSGTNELRISNRSIEGRPGHPPWFMVGRAMIGELADLPEPAEFEPFCEISRKGAKAQSGPGEPARFRIRGMKGMLWSPETYLEEIPFLAKYRFNLLMNCYTTLWDLETDGLNRWFRPLPKDKFEVMKRVVRACEEAGIEFCFCINPALNSPQPFDDEDGEDFQRLWRHFQSFQDLGVRWFSVAFDDISGGVDAAGQARTVNRLYARLLERDPEVRFILCPTVYHNRMLSESWAREYLRVLGEELNPEIEVFWTGPGVCSWRITPEDVDAFVDLIGRKPFVWDNYPVNDGAPLLHLAPLQERSPELHRHVSGYLFNPMYHHEINRLPAMTIADYLWDPENYDPWESIGQGILQLAETPEQRSVLRDLVELHCGFPTQFADHSGFGSIEEKLAWCRRQEDPEGARRELKARLVELRQRFSDGFPDRFQDVVAILGREIAEIDKE